MTNKQEMRVKRASRKDIFLKKYISRREEYLRTSVGCSMGGIDPRKIPLVLVSSVGRYARHDFKSFRTTATSNDALHRKVGTIGNVSWAIGCPRTSRTVRIAPVD